MNNDRLRFRLPKKCLNCGSIIYNYYNWDGLGFHCKYIWCKCGHEEESLLSPEQCTGKKDKHGELIYEGDTVEFEDYVDEDGTIEIQKGIVIWSNTGWCLQIDDEHWGLLQDAMEIVGTIHDKEGKK